MVINVKDLKGVPMFWCGIVGQILAFAGYSFFVTTLALHLASYEGFTPVWVGFVYASGAFFYIVNSLLVGTYCKFL